MKIHLIGYADDNHENPRAVTFADGQFYVVTDHDNKHVFHPITPLEAGIISQGLFFRMVFQRIDVSLDSFLQRITRY